MVLREHYRWGDIMEARKYDFLVVGSGMGGATLALELAKKDKDVLVLERGVKESKVGTLRDVLRFGDCNPLTQMPKKSKEGTILWRTFMAGGSTIVSCGNGVRSLESELAERGIDLEQDFLELEKDLSVGPIDERLLSEGSLALAEAGKELGFRSSPCPSSSMPRSATNAAAVCWARTHEPSGWPSSTSPGWRTGVWRWPTE